MHSPRGKKIKSANAFASLNETEIHCTYQHIIMIILELREETVYL